MECLEYQRRAAGATSTSSPSSAVLLSRYRAVAANVSARSPPVWHCKRLQPSRSCATLLVARSSPAAATQLNQSFSSYECYDVVGLGQAMVDVQFKLPDERLLQLLDVPVGGRRVITVDERAHAMDMLHECGCSSQVSAGGSVANTLVAIARLSQAAQRLPNASSPLRVCMAGSVGNDTLGQYFKAHMQAAGVQVLTGPARCSTDLVIGDPIVSDDSFDCSVPADSSTTSTLDDSAASSSSSSGGSSHTGTVMVLTTPGAQRSFLSFFASDELSPPLPWHIAAAVAGARVVVIEGYLWELPGAPAFMAAVVKLAQQCGAQVVLTAGDPGVVARHRKEILDVLQLGVDVVFTNTAEAGELIGRPGCDAQVAAAVLGGLAGVGVVTDGSRGSIISALGEIHVVPPHWAAEGPQDTCGAGDAYAAGVLYAVLQGHHLRAAGEFATRTASHVISRLGPQLLDCDADVLAVVLPRHAAGGSSTAAAAAAHMACTAAGLTAATSTMAGVCIGAGALLAGAAVAAVAAVV